MATPTLSVVPPLLQLDPKHQTAMRALISTVIRSFYEPKFFILMELLGKHHIFRDDELAGRVGLNVKDLNRLMAILTNHRLVQAYRQNEMKENQGRIVGKAYFYIDPQRFCNVVKWRISDMRNQIDNSLKSELDNKGYICPRCTKSFTALEVDQVFDFVRNILACDICGTELVDNENSEKVKGSKDRMQRFNAQMKWIRDGLRNIEGVVMPAFDVARYVREKMAAEKAMGIMDEDGLKVASGAGKAQQVEIQMVEDEDEEEKKKERQKNADEKRRQNALPSWHTTSTVSGEKTALGIKADERSSNEAILAQLEAQAKADEAAKAHSYDTFDTEEYYDKLINGEEDSPRGTKRKLEEAEYGDGRQAKMARRDEAGSHWGAPGGYPGMPGMPYGYPPHMMPMGHQNGMVPGHPHPMYAMPQKPSPPLPPSANSSYYRNPTPSPAAPFTSQSSAGTSRNTPSQNSDSESSQEAARKGAMGAGTGSGSAIFTTTKKKPSVNGLEKRVSFAEKVSERSPSPPPPAPVVAEPKAKVSEEYNPIVKVGGKDMRARDVKEGDDDLMTADEYEAYWLIKERIDEIDAAA